MSNQNNKTFKELNSKINDLNEIRNILLAEKRKNIRQKGFEEYLNTNVLNKDRKYFSKIFCDSKNLIFTNGISIYMVKPEFLNTDQYKLKLYSDSKTYKLKFINYDQANSYLEYVKMRYGDLDEPCFLFNFGDEFVSQYSYLEKIYRNYYFNGNEINMCCQILNNPTYKISMNNPILKAESKIGKAYILGNKRY